MSPKVTVIVPVYNVAAYLDNCFESIRGQTLQDFEVIVINDGSKDNSGEICDNWAAKDNRIHVIHKENGGVAKARNIGIERAKGEYLYFIDPDDWVEPTLLQDNYTLTNNSYYDIVIFGFFKELSLHGKPITQPVAAVSLDLNNKAAVEDKLSYYLKRNNGFSVWTKLIKRDLVVQNNIRFPFMKRGQDMAFSLELYKYCNSIKINPAAYYHYNINTTTNKFDPDIIDNHIFLFNKVFTLYEGWMDRKDNLDYALTLFMLWFGYVVPANLVGSKTTPASEKISQLKRLMEDADIQKYVSIFINKPGLSKSQKVYLSLYKSKSARIFYLLTKGVRFVKNNSLFLSKKSIK